MLQDKPFSTPSRTLITSFTPRKPGSSRPANDGKGMVVNGSTNIAPSEDGDWVLCLATDRGANGNGNAPPETLACALSNGEVQVYDAQRLHVARCYRPPRNLWSDHNYRNRHHNVSTVNDLKYGPQHSLVTAGQDGSINVFDLRKGEIASQGHLPPGQQALCMEFGFDGYLAAVGSSKARVHFFDLRKPSEILGSYVDSHRDDITQVSFSKTTPGLLLTASEDGLMCLFDATQPTEETALKSVVNVNAPVRKAGFCGNNINNNTLYALTGNETISIWNGENSSLIHDFGWESRQQLSAAIPHTVATASASAFSPPTVHNTIDYLVDASWEHGELLVLAGSATGNTSLFRLAQHTNFHNGIGGSNGGGLSIHFNNNAATPSQSHFQHLESFVGGHRGVVRAWCPLTPLCSSLITAGEDARLCEWHTRYSPAAIPPPVASPAPTTLGSSFLGNKRSSVGGEDSMYGSERRLRHKASSSP